MDTTTQILLDSLGQGDGPSVSDAGQCDWETIWVKARDHCLVPYLDQRWTESGFIAKVPEAIRVRFSNATSRNYSRNVQLLNILNDLNASLQGRNIPTLISKGLPVGNIYYGGLGMRVLYDIDLLIRSEDKDAALKTLKAMGYVPFYPILKPGFDQCLLWKPKVFTWGPEAVFDPEAPCFVELHTKAWEPHWHGFHMDCSLDPWTGARLQKISGVEIRLPSEEKLLIHLAVHYACNVLESNARLMHLLDIIQLLRTGTTRLHWESLQREIRNSNVASFCFLSFELARRIGGVDIPETFRSSLRNSTAHGIVDWLNKRGMDDIGSINPRECNRSLIYFLHWNMAASWGERASVFLYSLRAPWRESTGVGRLAAFVKRMSVRFAHLAKAARKN